MAFTRMDRATREDWDEIGRVTGATVGVLPDGANAVGAHLVAALPARVDAVLVGTALMTAADPGALVRTLAEARALPARGRRAEGSEGSRV